MVFEEVKITISAPLYNDINDYCVLNEMDTEKYIENILKKAFLVDKYGATPSIAVKDNGNTDRNVDIFVKPQKTIDKIEVDITVEPKVEAQIFEDKKEAIVEEIIEEKPKKNKRKLT